MRPRAAERMPLRANLHAIAPLREAAAIAPTSEAPRLCRGAPVACRQRRGFAHAPFRRRLTSPNSSAQSACFDGRTAHARIASLSGINREGQRRSELSNTEAIGIVSEGEDPMRAIGGQGRYPWSVE